MKLKTIREANEFMRICEEAQGSVWLESISGERYDLKDTLQCRAAVGIMLREEENDLELFAANRRDVNRFFGLFAAMDKGDYAA